jgi:hypothetical protein
MALRYASRKTRSSAIGDVIELGGRREVMMLLAQ